MCGMAQLSLLDIGHASEREALITLGIADKVQADEDAGLLDGDLYEPDFAEDL